MFFKSISTTRVAVFADHGLSSKDLAILMGLVVNCCLIKEAVFNECLWQNSLDLGNFPSFNFLAN